MNNIYGLLSLNANQQMSESTESNNYDHVSDAHELGNTHRIALALMKDMFTILRLIFCENLAATSAT